MKKIENLFIALLFLLIHVSCSEETEFNISDNEYAGKWNWVSTQGGFAAHINETPQSTGNSVQLILTGDSKFRVIENDEEVAAGTYEVSRQSSIYSENKEPYIQLSEDVPAVNVVLNGIVRTVNDSLLTIDDNFYDGIGSTFKRIK